MAKASKDNAVRPSDDDVKRSENLLLDQLIRRNPERAAKIIDSIRRSMEADTGNLAMDKPEEMGL